MYVLIVWVIVYCPVVLRRVCEEEFETGMSECIINVFLIFFLMDLLLYLLASVNECDWSISIRLLGLLYIISIGLVSWMSNDLYVKLVTSINVKQDYNYNWSI